MPVYLGMVDGVEYAAEDIRIMRDCIAGLEAENKALKAEIERVSEGRSALHRITVDQYKENEALKLNVKGWQQENAELQDRVSELEAENEALKADAERYRWCIQQDAFAGFLSAVYGNFTKPWYKAQVDAAIDAAREGE